MKLDEFIRHKQEIETLDISESLTDKDALKVYSWMEETGRIDEGVLGSVWSWLKRNFSPTSRKLHNLADEFGVEIKKEMQAEFDRREDSKNLAAKMRASWAGKISGDIKDRMDIIASDDDDYRKLVTYLINKKTYAAKREMLKYLDTVDASEIGKKLAKDERDNDTEGRKVIQSLTRDGLQKMNDLISHLRKEVDKYRNILGVRFKSNSESEKFIKLVVEYLFRTQVKYPKKVTLDEKGASAYLKSIVNMIERISNSFKNLANSQEDVIQVTIDELMKIFKEEKKDAYDLPTLENTVQESVKRKLSDSKDTEDSHTPEDVKDEVKDDLTTDDTETIITPDNVDTAINTAAKKSAGDDAESIEEEVKNAIDKWFKQNEEYLIDMLNDKIDDFNSLSSDEKKKAIDKFEYDLDANDKMKKVSTADAEDLFRNFVQLAGAITPYYANIDDKKRMIKVITQFIFEIYAVRKDLDKNMTSDDANTIMEIMKSKYPEEFK